MAHDDRPIRVRPALAWGFLRGFGMLIAGLAITLLLATVLQSRAEKQELADSSVHSQAMTIDHPFAKGVSGR